MSEAEERITDAELEVMGALWRGEGPMTLSQVKEAMARARGWNGDTTKTLLRRLCQQAGAELYVAPPVREGEQKVSSTRIRAAVEAGDIPLANRLLGRPFGFEFEVVHGNRIGRTIGTPTINQHFPEHFILPRFGVYASCVHIGGRTYCGVTNVGVKPTVGSDRALSETWIPDFSGDLYGKTLRLELLAFIRDEKKFANLDALKAEIRRNEKQARKIFTASRKEK